MNLLAMRFNNPLPLSMSSECRKCSKILASFVDPSQAFGPDKFIPPQVLANAKGLAILTVFKAGFLGSARYGNGVVVARLSDGSWSAPSAIGTAGAGFGGQIGFELTDFVFILNDSAAVRTFTQVGSLTFGGNVSVAAGPVGRNAEAAGAASLKGVAGIFSYSKTKGLFAGVSLEGSAIVERRDANEAFYGERLTASQLLSGSVPPPPAAQALLQVLSSKVFAGPIQTFRDSNQLSPSISYPSREPSRRRSVFGGGLRGHTRSRSRPPESPPHHRTTNQYSRAQARRLDAADEYIYSDTPTIDPPAAKAAVVRKPLSRSVSARRSKNEAIALFNFDAEQPGDLGFRKGDIITVTQASPSQEDWWTGFIGGRTGIFPANYVKMRA
ncbi:DUF500 and domain-containing protein [Blumeria hordei DH14]|uniref:DUF500 and domain-containing protein n=1 Tax=Blumeria graminis f. sp. hordei (strain DH14) TaxID=546991 RepID=N1JL70_BLUG1|nr:DUF500 and domain-containing protein [Blumeria hordei DH14]